MTAPEIDEELRHDQHEIDIILIMLLHQTRHTRPHQRLHPHAKIVRYNSRQCQQQINTFVPKYQAFRVQITGFLLFISQQTKIEQLSIRQTILGRKLSCQTVCVTLLKKW